MRYKVFEDVIVLRLETGDDIYDSIVEVCEKQQVKLGSVTGFGGLEYLKVGVWNNEKDNYDCLVRENINMEMLNLTGNISLKEGTVNVHMHVTAADNEFHVFGGHLMKGTVQNLAEILIYPSKGEVHRIPVKNWYFMDI